MTTSLMPWASPADQAGAAAGPGRSFVLFRGTFFTHFSQPAQVNIKACSAVAQAATFSLLLTLLNAIRFYSVLIFNPTS